MLDKSVLKGKRRGVRAGRRSTPAKRVNGLKPVSRVRIPPSPPFLIKTPGYKNVARCFLRFGVGEGGDIFVPRSDIAVAPGIEYKIRKEDGLWGKFHTKNHAKCPAKCEASVNLRNPIR